MTQEFPEARPPGAVTPAEVTRRRVTPSPLAAPSRTRGRGSPPARPAISRPGRTGRAVAAAALPAADAVALAVAAAAAASLPGARPGAGQAAPFAAAMLAALALGGLHRQRICLRPADQAGRIAVAALAAAVAVLAVPAWAGPPVPPLSVLGLALLSAALVLAARTAAATALRAGRRRGALAEPALIVGSGTFAAYLAGQLRDHPELGLRVAGFLEDGPHRRDLPEPVLGRPRDLGAVVRELGIRRILITFGEGRDEDLVPVLRACAALPAEVCLVPRLYELGLALPRGSLDEIWGIPLIRLRRGPRRAGMAAKRAFDIIAASLLLVVAAPVLLALGTVIRLRTGQPALFRQLRVTGPGRESTILKLRTVTEPAASDGHSPVPAQRRWTPEPGQCRPLGRWLRATHLDELPQLVNVIRGDMSLVGPRPERGCFAAGFAREIPRYADRDRVRAGLTGWAQVHGLHGDTSIVTRSQFDNQYIEYWSPWLDLVILVRTIRAALAGLGAGGGTSR